MENKGKNRLNAGRVLAVWGEATRWSRLTLAYAIALNHNEGSEGYVLMGPEGPVNQDAAKLILGQILADLNNVTQ